MKITLFVTGSAAILATWLGMTYLQAVPVKTYPQLGRGSVPLSAQVSAPSVKAQPSRSMAKTTPASPEAVVAH